MQTRILKIVGGAVVGVGVVIGLVIGLHTKPALRPAAQLFDMPYHKDRAGQWVVPVPRGYQQAATRGADWASVVAAPGNEKEGTETLRVIPPGTNPLHGWTWWWGAEAWRQALPMTARPAYMAQKWALAWWLNQAVAVPQVVDAFASWRGTTQPASQVAYRAMRQNADQERAAHLQLGAVMVSTPSHALKAIEHTVEVEASTPHVHYPAAVAVPVHVAWWQRQGRGPWTPLQETVTVWVSPGYLVPIDKLHGRWNSGTGNSLIPTLGQVPQYIVNPTVVGMTGGTPHTDPTLVRGPMQLAHPAHTPLPAAYNR